jgi:hypothetical protein
MSSGLKNNVKFSRETQFAVMFMEFHVKDYKNQNNKNDT